MEYTIDFLRHCYGLRFRTTISEPPEEGVIKVKNSTEDFPKLILK